MTGSEHLRRATSAACAACLAAALLLSPPPTAHTQGPGSPRPGAPQTAPQRQPGKVITLPPLIRKNARPASSRTGLVKRAPLQFKPFPMTHPKTGKALNPNAVMTLPSGKKLTVKGFYDQINKAEQKLNSQGYTLRLPGQLTVRKNNFNVTKLKSLAAAGASRRIPAQQLASRKSGRTAELAQSRKLASQQQVEDALKQSINEKTGGGGGSSGGVGNGAGGGKGSGTGVANGGSGGGTTGAATKPRTDSLEKSFDWRWPAAGDNFSVYLRGGLFARKDTGGTGVLGVKAYGKAEAGAELFNPERLYDGGAANLNVPLGSVEVELSAGGVALAEHGKPLYRDLKLNSLSVNYQTAEPGQGGAYPLQYQFERAVKIGESQTFLVFGFLPVTLTYDISGAVRLTVDAVVYKQAVTGRLNSNAHLYAGGSAVAGHPDIAWAGVEINLNLLDDNIDLYVNTYKLGGGGFPLEGEHQFSALKGGLTLTAGFIHPCPNLLEQAEKIVDSLFAAVTGEDIPIPLCKTETRDTVWAFDGYSSSEALF